MDMHRDMLWTRNGDTMDMQWGHALTPHEFTFVIIDNMIVLQYE